jgi:hypothetical protein
VIAVWQGPFPAEVKMPVELGSTHAHLKISAGGSTVVLAATASQMAAADPR